MIDLYKANGELKARAKLLYDFREVKVNEAKELWIEEQRVAYELAYPSFEIVTDADLVETIVELEQAITFEEYLAETHITQVAVDSTETAEAIAEVKSLVREFVAPEIPESEFDAYINPLLVPKVVTMRQARLALLQAGLLDTIQSTIMNGIDDAMKIEWEYALDVRRDWDSLIALTTTMGMTSSNLDDLFTLAGSL